MRTLLRLAVAAVALTLVTVGLAVIGPWRTDVAGLQTPLTVAAAAAPVGVPRPDHVVIVMMENKHRSSVIGSKNAPYLNELASRGANMAASYGVTHPSQPNYIALFSGSQQGFTTNKCRTVKGKDNLASQLLAAGLTFSGYSESLPKVGYRGCEHGPTKSAYERKHAPWVSFDNVPATLNRPLTDLPSDYATLPTVSFVTPNMCHDMHNCSVRTGDDWLRDNLDGYANWASQHNSLLVVTFDENAGGTVNQIPTVIVGQSVRPGTYAEQMNHYSLLRTLQDAYGLPALGHSRIADPLQTIWTTSPASAQPAAGLTNGSFELGVAGWAGSGSVASVSTARHGGTLAARAGKSAASSGDSILSQTVSVPPGASKLTVAWKGRCQDKVSKAYATIIVKQHEPARKLTLLPRTCTRSSKWHSAGLAVRPGLTYTVSLINHDDGKKSTPNRSYFDDIALS